MGGHHALIEQLCMTRTNIPTFFLSLFISMQLVCPQVFGCEWHAEMKAADATNGLDWMLLLCGRSAPLPLLFSLDLWSLKKHNRVLT